MSPFDETHKPTVKIELYNKKYIKSHVNARKKSNDLPRQKTMKKSHMYFLMALLEVMSATTAMGMLSAVAPKYWSTRSSVWGTCTWSILPRCFSATWKVYGWKRTQRDHRTEKIKRSANESVNKKITIERRKAKKYRSPSPSPRHTYKQTRVCVFFFVLEETGRVKFQNKSAAEEKMRLF